MSLLTVMTSAIDDDVIVISMLQVLEYEATMFIEYREIYTFRTFLQVLLLTCVTS